MPSKSARKAWPIFPGAAVYEMRVASVFVAPASKHHPYDQAICFDAMSRAMERQAQAMTKWGRASRSEYNPVGG